MKWQKLSQSRGLKEFIVQRSISPRFLRKNNKGVSRMEEYNEEEWVSKNIKELDKLAIAVWRQRYRLLDESKKRRLRNSVALSNYCRK